MLTRSHALLLITAIGLIGCGGNSLSGTRSPSLRVSPSRPSILYGEQVTVSWDGTRINRIAGAESNFPIQSSLTEGSIIDQPAISTTYTVVGVGDDARDYQGQTSVTVAPSAKNFLVIGDMSQAGMPQMVDYLKSITTGSVQTRLDIPSSIAIDVLILFSSGSFGSATDRNTIQGFLAAGGRLMLISTATAKLATGDETSSNLSAIGSWFGGANRLSSFSGDDVVSANPGIPLSTTVLGDQINKSVKNPLPIASTAIQLMEDATGAFVYAPPIGGHVGYVGAMGVGTSDADRTITELMLAIVRWLADGV